MKHDVECPFEYQNPLFNIFLNNGITDVCKILTNNAHNIVLFGTDEHDQDYHLEIRFQMNRYLSMGVLAFDPLDGGIESAFDPIYNLFVFIDTKTIDDSTKLIEDTLEKATEFFKDLDERRRMNSEND